MNLNNIKRIPLKIIVNDSNNNNLKDRYGGVSGSFILEGELLKPKNDKRTHTIGIFMHPTASTSMLPLPYGLVKMGMHICVALSRYPNNDSNLNVDNLIIDLSKFINHLKYKLGYQSIILFGWSGGGSLLTLYQSRAQLSTNNLISGDLLILIASHCGRAYYLTESLDPSIYLCQKQLSDPKELEYYNIYNENNKPPYSKDFLIKYRKAQKERSKRITEYAKTLSPNTPLIIEGTMADPRWLDLNIDPNDRTDPGYCFLGNCKEANNIPTGLARFTTAGSWLSQWSFEESDLNSLKHLPNIKIPILIISNSADNGVPESHGKMMFNSIKHNKKEYHSILKATHYFIKGNPPRLQKKQLFECVSIICNFIDNYSNINIESLINDYSIKNWDLSLLNNNTNNNIINSSIYPYSELPIAPQTQGFNHIAMVCSDMAATIRFYCGILGFKLVKTLELPDGGQHFFIHCGDKNGGMLAFFWWEDIAKERASGIATASKKQMDKGKIPKSVPGSVNHIAFNYPEDGLELLRKRLIKANIKVSPILYHANNEIGFALDRNDPTVIACSIYLWGPDNEMIEFSSSTENMFPLKASERIKHEPKFLQLSKL